MPAPSPRPSPSGRGSRQHRLTPTRYGLLCAPGRDPDLIEGFLRSATPAESRDNGTMWQCLMAADGRATAAKAKLAELSHPMRNRDIPET